MIKRLIKPKADLLFEVSWEVCNKVGGIYTVVKSKAATMLKCYEEKYFVVGPYFPKKAIGEFQEKIPPDFLRVAFEKLKKEGISCHYGRWLVYGEPNAVLIDYSAFAARKNEIKTELWNNYKIDSLNTQYFDFDEPIIWGYAAGKLLEEISKKTNKKIVAQVHEWLSGAALLYLKSNAAKVSTVFTTHATILGRTIASSNMDLYSLMGKINPEEEAYRFGIQAKHQTEKQCAQNADVFTTVSEITGIEAGKILGRKPDVLLENGIDTGKFSTFEEAVIRHRVFKRRIKEFIEYYFFPYYTFDLDNAMIYFLCGRYEFHDKGVDIFIKALSKLNDMLKQNNDKTIIAFLWLPGNIRCIRPELLESRTFYEDVKESVEQATRDITEKIIYSLIAKKKYLVEQLLGKDLVFDVERKVLKLLRQGTPSVSTHELYNEETDLIISNLKKYNLQNKESDKVKVVFYPIYLTGADGLLDLNYYESMQGAHLGVFPSYYEPWGYTPLESGALGVPSVTTDLAGFGRFVKKHAQKTFPGIFVLPRLNRKEEDVVEDLAMMMYNFAKLPKEERVKNKIEAKRLSELADWKSLIEKYIEAHNRAVEKMDRKGGE